LNTLAFIPARGGSKGIPRKNLAVVGGKTLLQRAIESAKGCTEIDRVFISSDNEEILSACQDLGIPSEYRRPSHLAGDRADVVDAVIDALDWLQARGENYHTVIVLQPTSALRSVADVAGALGQFLSTPRATTLVSVHRMTEHPFECLKVNPNGWDWLEKPLRPTSGRQDYEGDYFFVNGAIYIGATDYIRKKRKLLEPGETMLYVMPRDRGIDIDDLDQLKIAEWRLKFFETDVD